MTRDSLEAATIGKTCKYRYSKGISLGKVSQLPLAVLVTGAFKAVQHEISQVTYRPELFDVDLDGFPIHHYEYEEYHSEMCLAIDHMDNAEGLFDTQMLYSDV
ncbi:hypothetical protein Tco_0686731 [Tanacetum coccineum]